MHQYGVQMVCTLSIFLSISVFFLVLTKFLQELYDRVKANAASDAKQKHKTPERRPRVQGSPLMSTPPERPPKWTVSKDWVKGTS